MLTEKIDRKKFDSFGECIYCGRKPPDVELTDEHIVPFSLGANAIIENGSCKDCAVETGKIESVVGRGSHWDFRTHINEQTRRPKERSKTIPFVAIINGERKEITNVAAADAPFFTPYPVWGMPRILKGQSPVIEFEHQKAHVFYWIPPNIRETLGLGESDEVRFPFPKFDINLQQFGRAIAGFAEAR